MPKPKNTEKSQSIPLPSEKKKVFVPPIYGMNTDVAFTYFRPLQEKEGVVPYVVIGKIIGALMQLEQDTEAGVESLLETWFYTISVEDLGEAGGRVEKKFVIPEHHIIAKVS